MSGISKASGAIAVAAIAALLSWGNPPSALAGEWVWPVRGSVITPYLNDSSRPYAAGMHRGIDIASPVGATVRAAHAGRVTYAGMLGSSGLTVAIATADGRYDTSYLHLSGIDVARGDRVVTASKLGAVGVTGRRSASEPHLHFGVRVAGSDHSYVDPLGVLPPLRGGARGAAAPPATRPAPAALQPAPVPSLRPVPVGPAVVARDSQRAPRVVPARQPAVVRQPVPSSDWGRWLALAGATILAFVLFRRAFRWIPAPVEALLARLAWVLAWVQDVVHRAYEWASSVSERSNARARRRLNRRPSSASALR